jgi:hypothetical protein
MMSLYTVADRRTPHHFALAVGSRRPAAVVVFQSYPAAHFVARALEHREHSLCQLLERGAWQQVNELLPAPMSLSEPAHLFPHAWGRVEDLVAACDADGHDVLVCERMEPRLGQPLVFPGRVFEFEV